MSEHQNLQNSGYVLWMSLNAVTKFQLHIFPIDRVAALNVN